MNSDNWSKLITVQNLQFPLKNWCFSIVTTFSAPFVKLRGCRLLHFYSLCDVRNKVVFLILENSSLRWVKQKKHEKKHEILVFKSRFTEMEWNWIIFTSLPPPYGFIKNLRQIHRRDSHAKITGKNKVGNTT